MTDLSVPGTSLPATFEPLTTYIFCRAALGESPKPNQRCRRASQSFTRYPPVCMAQLAPVPAGRCALATTAFRSSSRPAQPDQGPAGTAAGALLDAGTEERALGAIALQPLRGAAHSRLRQGVRARRSLGNARLQLAPRAFPTQDAAPPFDFARLLRFHEPGEGIANEPARTSALPHLQASPFAAVSRLDSFNASS